MRLRPTIVVPPHVLILLVYIQAMACFNDRRRNLGDASLSIIYVGMMGKDPPNSLAASAICHTMACDVNSFFYLQPTEATFPVVTVV